MTDTLPEFLLHWAERAPDTPFVTEPDRAKFVYVTGRLLNIVTGR